QRLRHRADHQPVRLLRRVHRADRVGRRVDAPGRAPRSRHSRRRGRTHPPPRPHLLTRPAEEDPVNLADLWFVIVAVFWTGFLALEGFDVGVGALHSVVGRSETERRVAINTVGPFWDGNEVWLVVGGAAIFAAFPAWYATWFSAGYLVLVLILLALMI